MKARTFLAILLILAFVLGACAPSPVESEVNQPPAEEATQPPAAEEATEPPAEATEPPAEATQPPTEDTGIAEDGIQYYYPNPPEYDQAKINMDYEGKIITITLRPDVKWSDGSPITTQDIIGTYEIFWATKQFIWDYITEMEAVDEQTVVFYLNDLNFRSQRFLLRDKKILPYSMYGDLMDRAAALREAGALEGADFDSFIEDLNAFRPQVPVVSGPFMIENEADMTESQLTFFKNPNFFNADKIDYTAAIYLYGETAACAPLVQSHMVDYSTAAYSPAMTETFEEMGIEVLRTPLGAGMGIGFNWNKHPFELKEVRQAFAYVIDRVQNAEVANGKSGNPFKYMAGLPDSAAEVWVPNILDELNPYEKDLAKAEELLTSVGFTKGSDGIWVDDTGKPMDYKLWVPGSWIDTLGTATDAAEQLTNFGIRVEVQPYQDTERRNIMSEGNYDLIADLHGSYYNPPHPYRFFELNLLPYFNEPENATTPGMGIPLDWEIDGEMVNLRDLIAEMVAGTDVDQQMPAIEAMIKLYNEELLTLPMWERLTASPVDKTRSTGWLPFDHHIYVNNHTGDPYTFIQIMEGILKPGPDGVYQTCNAYTQPPKGHFNMFIADAYIADVPDLFYPSLFYYMWGLDQYIPMLGASFEILK